MRNIFTLLIVSLIAIASGEARIYKVEDVPNVHIADRSRFVSNPDGIMSAAAVAAADSALSRIRRSTTAEVVAVMVGDVDGADIDIFANELFNHWGLGKSDNNNGVLILVARDSRNAVIRTGPGVEGVLTDAACGRILREQMFPAFREGDYDSGVINAVNAVGARLGDPVAVQEIRSGNADSDYVKSGSAAGLKGYLTVVVLVTILLSLIIGLKYLSLKKATPFEKYTAFENWKAPLLIVSFVGLGIPLIATLPLFLMLRHWRNSPRRCPNCNAKMIKIDEVHDNDYLTPAQDCEERIGSVDYDVWHCPECGTTEIYPFVNKSLPLTECDNCHARTAKLVSDRVVTQPTALREGVGAKDYVCMNCHHKTRRLYPIAKLPPTIIIPGGRRGGFGGGGSFGGGFGGGFTGGGGASGRW